jgi:putative RecB family exonuclease
MRRALTAASPPPRVLYFKAVVEGQHVPLWSHSRLSTFEKCPLQYRYRYVDKIKRDTQSIEAFLGNRVHEILETLYRDLQAAKIPSLDELLALYHRRWDESLSDKITIVKTEFAPDHYRKIGVECITKYYQAQHPFDDGTTLALEDRVTLALDDKGRYQLQGYIDRLVRQEQGVYEIHDYKTSSGRPPSEADLRKDRQLTIYRMAIARRYPDAREIRLVWHYLVWGLKLTSDRTPDEIERQRRHMIGLIDTIEATKEYPPKVTALCGWCEYRDICPEFAGPEPPAKPKTVRWLDKAEQIGLFK